MFSVLLENVQQIIYNLIIKLYLLQQQMIQALYTKIFHQPVFTRKDVHKMDNVQKWAYRLQAKEMVDILNSKNFNALYADNAEEAKKLFLELIPEGASVCVGGSVTLKQTGIMDEIESGRYDFYDRFHCESVAAMHDVYRESYKADFMVSSSNAVTREGQLVNIDCVGNRASQIAFGPKKVIIIAGVNKIVDTMEDGIKRARSIAPLNAKRIRHKTPCATDDCCTCSNCEGQPRMCNFIGIVDGCFHFPKRITVIMVAEELGY